MYLCQIGRTEKIKNCLNPKFSKTFVIDYYFEMVQRLKFCVYDIDNNTYDLGDDDFLGELECTLCQVSFTFCSSEILIIRLFLFSLFCDTVSICVQIVSNRQMTRPLLLKNGRAAGRGTITVSRLFSHLTFAIEAHSVLTQTCTQDVLDGVAAAVTQVYQVYSISDSR